MKRLSKVTLWFLVFFSMAFPYVCMAAEGDGFTPTPSGTPAQPAAIPALNWWGIFVLVAALIVFGWVKLRRANSV